LKLEWSAGFLFFTIPLFQTHYFISRKASFHFLMSCSLKTADLRRQKFTPDEDARLCNLVLQFGMRDWVTISQHMTGRNARQCRHRYKNYLIEDRKVSAWTEQEDKILIEKFQVLGSKWVEIANHLPGRTGNNVKNRWHKHILKKHSTIDITPLKQPPTKAVVSPIEYLFSDSSRFFDEILSDTRTKNQNSSYLQLVLN
jgi:hypothetical protein